MFSLYFVFAFAFEFYPVSTDLGSPYLKHLCFWIFGFFNLWIWIWICCCRILGLNFWIWMFTFQYLLANMFSIIPAGKSDPDIKVPLLNTRATDITLLFWILIIVCWTFDFRYLGACLGYLVFLLRIFGVGPSEYQGYRYHALLLNTDCLVPDGHQQNCQHNHSPCFQPIWESWIS